MKSTDLTLKAKPRSLDFVRLCLSPLGMTEFLATDSGDRIFGNRLGMTEFFSVIAPFFDIALERN
jgi:hypothetical protein